ncbi:50S ribosomal protein L10 [Candidatus Fermentibacterales bacterium]|nr:50S ribosomal protein L10 [Candidatus Fermentibacterales bacterium]
MSEGRIQKQTAVTRLIEQLGNVRCMVLADFTGISVEEMGVLRRSMRAAGVTFRVVKNTIAKRAFGDLDISDGEAGLLSLLQGPTAIAWADDEVTPVKVIQGFSKSHDGKLVIKGGLVSGRHLDADQTAALGSLPGRDELLARLVGSLNAPLYGFVSVASNLIRGFQNALRALSEKRDSE